MAEDNAKGRIAGWLKAGVTSVFGLVSGAVLMYVTPLVNNAVKPPEPIANFGFQAQGLAVTFQNRAVNATDGWWDFGDGSALEPYAPQQPAIAHTYAKPGSYIVKLSLTNLFNEKNERSITVSLDGGGAPAPVIEKFTVAPLTPGMKAPAVFHLVATVKNADQVMWICGESKPVEISVDSSGAVEKWVNIDEPGNHRFRIVAVSGKQVVEKITEPVYVDAPPQNGNAPMAWVTVTYDAVHIERLENVTADVRLPWKLDCRDNVCPVAVEWQPKPGYKVVKAELNGNPRDARVRGTPRVEVAPDQMKVIVSADMVRPTNLLSHLVPPHQVPIKVTLEKRGNPTVKSFVVPMAVNKIGDKTVIPIPAPSSHWQATARRVKLDLMEGGRKIWSGTEMPVNRPLELQGRPVVVNAAVQNNQLVLTVTNPQGGLSPLGN